MKTTHQADFLEDTEQGAPIIIGDALTDEQLNAGGLTPVRAWVRTRQGANALRTQRYKDKQAAEGIKQVNVQAPETVRPVLKELATRTAAGEDLAAVLRDLASTADPRPAATAPQPQSPDPAEIIAVRRTLAAGGWRARLIRWVIKRV